MISRPKLAMASIAKIYGFLNHVYCDTCIFPRVLLKKPKKFNCNKLIGIMYFRDTDKFDRTN